MRIGTTPTHSFVLPISTDEVNKVEITYVQNNEIKLRKTEADCKLQDDVVSVKLMQKETFLFDENATVKIQVRVVTNGDDVLSSGIFCVSADECLSDTEL